jgi:hypothetical protein
VYENQISARRDFLALAKFVAHIRAVKPQAWKSVERLKLACALEAVWTPMLACDLLHPSFARTMHDVRSELGHCFDDSELAEWLSSPNVWLQCRVPVDLLVSDASSVLAAARTDRFVVEG